MCPILEQQFNTFIFNMDKKTLKQTFQTVDTFYILHCKHTYMKDGKELLNGHYWIDLNALGLSFCKSY